MIDNDPYNDYENEEDSELDELTKDFLENELDEEGKDYLFYMIASDVEKEDRISQIINLSATKKMKVAYDLIKKAVDGMNVKIEYKSHSPYKTVGYIGINGKNLDFINIKPLITAMRLSSNVDIYPKLDKTIQIDFTFNDLTKVI